jgi:hypothetical protein
MRLIALSLNQLDPQFDIAVHANVFRQSAVEASFVCHDALPDDLSEFDSETSEARAKKSSSARRWTSQSDTWLASAIDCTSCFIFGVTLQTGNLSLNVSFGVKSIIF